jgi:hypothetical protein
MSQSLLLCCVAHGSEEVARSPSSCLQLLLLHGSGDMHHLLYDPSTHQQAELGTLWTALSCLNRVTVTASLRCGGRVESCNVS